MGSSGMIDTPVGALRVESDGVAVTRVSWVAASRGPGEGAAPDPVLAEALDRLGAYFAGDPRAFDLAVDLGPQTDVTRAVLTTLYETVGHGESVTYGELAARSGTGIPARAIGSIMGANPIPIVVPCHRVVAGDGLGGYSGGAPGQGRATKRWLLEHEGVLPRGLF